MLLDDIEDQLKDLFTGNEIITITNEFADSVGEKVTFQTVSFNSKKDILSTNINDLSIDARIRFFSEIKDVRRVVNKPELVKQIDQLISGTSGKVQKSRESISSILDGYSPKLKEMWLSAVNSYNENNSRNALDSIRLTLELLCKEILQNNKSLENQKKDLGKYLQSKGVTSQFRNLLFRVLDMYEKIQNDHAKHDVPQLSHMEISYLMNQSVLLIKFINDCENGGELNAR